MDRTFLFMGSLFAFLGVALGAFAAHALEARLEPRALDVFETGARYQMTHALALLLTGLVLARWPGSLGVWAGWAFVAGILIFSGSLYVLALSGVRAWGAVTPVGGVAFLVGWILLGAHILRS
jgi:uncharacterized membrane protein YgdD (TMEM256/DUF423 family)